MNVDVTPIDLQSIYCGESNENDKIYQSNPRTMNMFPVITDDSDYRDTDYKINVFSSMGDGLKTIHQNNIVTPVRNKHRLSALGTGLNLSDGIGVYLVETFTLSTKSGVDVNGMISHYLESDALSVSVSVKTEITNLIKAQSTRARSAVPITIRLVTFIPRAIMAHHSSVYIPSCNLVISVCDYDMLPIHPWSGARLSHDAEARLKHQPANVISIDITDHSNNDTGMSDSNLKIGRSFYMSIGDKVHKLSSSTDSITPSGATIVLKKQGSVTDVISNIPLEELEEHGIFTNEADAIYHGDNKLQIEDTRLKHDLQKLTFDKEKLKISHNEYRKEAKLKRKKLKHENTKLLEESAAFKISSENDIKKLEHELAKMDHDIIKMKHDLMVANKKYSMETLYNEYKTLGIMLDMSRDSEKHIYEISRNEQKHKLESIRLTEKHTHDMDRMHLDGVWKGVMNSVGIIKSIFK